MRNLLLAVLATVCLAGCSTICKISNSIPGCPAPPLVAK